MRLKSSVAIVMGLLCAGSLAAQRPQTLPTSGEQVQVPATTPAVAAAALPAMEPENVLHLDLLTGGRVSIQLRPDVAPRHVERIKMLARQGFYNGLVFHRVIEGFMAQTGDPTGTGQGGSTLPDVAAEFNALPHVRGAVSAARTTAPDSANSQFFITFAPRFALDGKYSVFGRVVSGMNYVDAIVRGEPPATPSRIIKASVGADNAPLPTEAETAAAMQRPAAPLAPAVATASVASPATAPAPPAAEPAPAAAAEPAAEVPPAPAAAPATSAAEPPPAAVAEPAAEAPATPQ